MALMQLVAYGCQDVYLTGSPEISFWKVNYRRTTKFSMIRKLDRKYNNFNIELNDNSNDPDMISMNSISLNHLNKNTIFTKCQIIKEEKKKKEKVGGGNLFGTSGSKYFHRSESKNMQKQIKSQLKLKRR